MKPCGLVLLAFWAVSCGSGESAVVRELRPGTPFEDEMAPEEMLRYSLDLDAGQFVHVVVDQRGIDVVTTLLSPAGDPIIAADRDIGYQGPEPLLAVVPVAGTYTLVLEAYPGDVPPGRYEIGLRDLRDASEEDRSRARAAALVAEGKTSKDSDQAVALWKQALGLWEEAGDEFWQAETLYLLAFTLKTGGEREEAARLFQRSAALFGTAGYPVGQATALNEMGVLCRRAGEIERAINYYKEALSISRAAGDPLRETISSTNLGQAYRSQGRYDQALEIYRQVLELSDERRDRSGRAQALHDLGVIYRILGKPELAKDHLTEAEREFSALGERRYRAASLNQLGKLLQEHDAPEEAIAFHRQALQLRREEEDRRGEANTLVDIGLTHQALHRTGEALGVFIEALTILRTLKSPRPLVEAKVLLALGSLYGTLGEASQALKSLAESVALYRRFEDPAGEAQALLHISAAQAGQGDLAAAHETAGEAVDLVEQVRLSAVSPDLRSSYFSTVQVFFGHQIELLMRSHEQRPDAGYDAFALQASERARARSFLEMLAEAGADIRSGVAAEWLAREKEVQERLNDRARRLYRLNLDPGDRQDLIEKEEKELRKIAAELDTVRSEIRARSPRYAALTQPRPLDVEEIQRQLLDEETLLLEIHLGEKRSFLWLVARDDLDVVEIPSRDLLETLARRTTEQLGKSNRSRNRKISQSLLCELSDALLGPIADRLAGQRLVIVADAALQYVPFAALPDPKAPQGCAAAPPLLVDHEIVYAPSASALATLRRETRQRSPAPGLVAVLADPVFSAEDARVRSGVGSSPESFQRLKHSLAEAEAILSLVPPEHRRILLGFEANKENVLAGRLGGYRIVHFATHAVLDTEQPDLSRLVLSQVETSGRSVDDASLRLHEIYNLDLPAELVVLSACETALGKEVRGEGLVGLTRGFMYAGARRVMVSLWNVSDESTSALMTHFYQGLLEQGMTPAAALRKAQLAMWRRQENPFYWAAFVLQGEWGPLPAWNERAQGE